MTQSGSRGTDDAGDRTRLDAEAIAAYAARPSDPVALERVLGEAAGVPLDEGHPVLAAVHRGHADLALARTRGAVYGLTTGVGALHRVAVADGAHGLRLLRAHAAGVGPELDDGLARATMLVRLRQLLRGGSGVHPRLVIALVEALRRGAVPRLHTYGAIGTGDLTVLSELALTLAGELPWRSGDAPPAALDPGDALPFISSNAMTVALSAVELTRLAGQARAAERVAALSHLALRGSLEAYDARVHSVAQHPHAAGVAQRLRTLLTGRAPRPAARLQDPFGLRALPQVHGAWEEQLAAATHAVTVEANAAAENPLSVDGTALHHGQFLTQRLAACLDGARQAAIPALGLSVARLASLCEPELTGLPAFLASGPAGSSGLMILEYVANDLLARTRVTATPVTAASTTVSLGLENHASHSTQAAWLTRDLVGLVPELLACELVTAVRALRLAPDRVDYSPAREFYAMADDALPGVGSDHVLGPDIRAAAEVIGRFVAID